MTEALGEMLAGVIRYALYIIEAIAVLVLIALARRNPSLGNLWFRRLRSSFTQFARRRALAVLSVGLLAVLIRVALIPILPPRIPAIADEFSYVLAGDTFALGRMTNPPHPMGAYFESPHVLQHPTYMSMYFPAPGLFLAAGKRLMGAQFWGVWLSVGLMCASICWMLQGWLPPSWALLGGLLAMMRLGLFGYWMNSYFGGAVPALGGALVLGAMPRILRKQRVLDAVLLGIGFAVLANSRPFEGVFLCLPVVCRLVWSIAVKRVPLRAAVLRVGMPVALLLVITATATGYYDSRVTGSPFQIPQALRVRQMMIAPYLLWGSMKPEPFYPNEALRGFHAGAEMQDFQRTRTIQGWIWTTLHKLRDFWLFYLGPVFTLPLVMLPRVLRDKRIRFLLIAGACMLPAFLVNVWFYAHYAAPATALFYAVLLQCMRYLRAGVRSGRPAGLLLARGIPVLCVLMVIVRLGAQPLAAYMPLDFPMTWYSTRPGGVYRAAIIDRLHKQGGQHLILVRWLPGDNPFEQWVYNEPDVDRSRVVWAWEPDRPDELLKYFEGRTVWLLHVPWERPPTLSRYYPGSPH